MDPTAYVRCLMFVGLAVLFFFSGCRFSDICCCVGYVIQILHLIPTCEIHVTVHRTVVIDIRICLRSLYANVVTVPEVMLPAVPIMKFPLHDH